MNDDCRRIAGRLTPYVDRQLDPAEQAEIERHLAQCPPCQRVAAAETGGREVLRARAAALTGDSPPPGLRARCAALAREEAQRSARRGLPQLLRLPIGGRMLPALAAGLLVLVAAAAGLALATRWSDRLLATQLIADHTACFRLHTASATGDAAAVEQALAGRYGWRVDVPPSSAAHGVQLIGARRCLYADGTMPHVMYRVHGQDVSLYMLDGVARRAAEIVSLGHESRIWSSGSRTFVLVSPAGAGDFTAAARYVMQEAH